jgi:hypothetical protein
MKKIIIIAIIAVLAVFLLIQLVPYGRQHTNPPVVQEPAWKSPEARQSAQRACFDCHSNETVWPWYSYIAPTSWLVANHVDEGREVLNFSDWTGTHSVGEEHNHNGEGHHEIPEVIEEGTMPPAYYLLLHPSARLNAQEKQTLIDGMP